MSIVTSGSNGPYRWRVERPTNSNPSRRTNARCRLAWHIHTDIQHYLCLRSLRRLRIESPTSAKNDRAEGVKCKNENGTQFPTLRSSFHLLQLAQNFPIAESKWGCRAKQKQNLGLRDSFCPSLPCHAFPWTRKPALPGFMLMTGS